MDVTIGEEGLNKTWQQSFEKTTECCRCKEEARIAFVAHEGLEDEGTSFRAEEEAICDMYKNHADDKLWLHDYCAVAVYFCTKCLETTALYNQG